MHVTSNPSFAFHDDVFPAFSKNAVYQKRFHKTFGKTIIPDNPFISLEDSDIYHISSLQMKFEDKESYKLELKVNLSRENEPLLKNNI